MTGPIWACGVPGKPPARPSGPSREGSRQTLGVVTRSMWVDYIEDSFKKAGLKIERCEVLGSEWGEYSQEHVGKPGQRLLRVARLLRKPEH